MESLKNLEKYSEYDNHHLVVKVEDEKTGLCGFIAIHRSRSDFPALGATRLWSYESEEDALRDALRLSKFMSYKMALAGLPYTGAKATLVYNPKVQENREEMFKVYAQKVNKLQGKFVTGTDVGVSNKDLDVMCKESKFMIGSGVDSGYYTARAVLDGIKLALKKRFGTDDISQRTFAIQGLGKTGWPLLTFLIKEHAAKIYVTDINPRKVLYAKVRHPSIKVVNPVAIQTQDVDVFCPCALSRTINSENVDLLKCTVIAGPANNQLDKNETGLRLAERGIVYAPDFVINAGGVISVVDQYNFKKHDSARILNELPKITESLSRIFDKSIESKRATIEIANEIAEDIIKNYN